MTAVVLVISAILLLVPIALLVNLLRKRHTSKVEWLVAIVTAASFTGYCLLIGRWDFFSYYLRPLVALALPAALVISLIRVRRAPWWIRPRLRRDWLNFGAKVVIASFFVGLFGFAAAGLSPGSARPVQLSFPLQDGVFYVGQGGASTLLNYHHANTAQAYALDIAALNGTGLHAWGLTPSELNRYAAYGRSVQSPCAGTVIEARDGLPDLEPPAADRKNLAGNHVVLRCAGTDPAVDVLLAHLQQGSLSVEKGAQVSAGQLLGRVGNTGNTSEPHLHVHAVRTGSGTVLDGEGVPILFDGRFLVRNSLIFRS